MVFDTEVIFRMDRGEIVSLCYANFQKDFDSENHRLLDSNSKAFGVDAEVNKWTAQSLKGRSFR